MHTHKLTCRHVGGGCWGVNRGRENTYIHLLVQEVDNELRTIEIEQMWTIMVNWCGWVSNFKAWWHYRLCLWLLTTFLHSHKSHNYPHWQPCFSHWICELAHKYLLSKVLSCYRSCTNSPSQIATCHSPSTGNKRKWIIYPRVLTNVNYQLLPYLPLTCRNLIEQVCIQYASQWKQYPLPAYHMISVPIIQPFVCCLQRLQLTLTMIFCNLWNFCMHETIGHCCLVS